MDNITEILERIGLTKGESSVYLALLELGSSTTGPIIDKSSVSASKVYEILDRLAKKGLVSYITKEKTKVYTVQDPHQLVDFLNEQKKEIEDNKKAINEIMPQLMLKKESGSPEPIVQVLEGRKGFILAHDKLINELEQGGKYRTLTTGPVSDKFRHYFKEFNQNRESKNISMWIIYQPSAWNISNEKKIERQQRKRYHPRLCPGEFFIPNHITLVNDSCLLCMVSDKIISILIRNKEMVNGFKQYFKYVWKISKTPKGHKEYKQELF